MMSTTDELFSEMEENSAKYILSDDDEYVTLENEHSRRMIIPQLYSTIGVESDEKVKVVQFKFPRHIGNNVDLSKLSIRINYRRPDGYIDRNSAKDVNVSGEYVTFGWELTRNVTAIKGSLYFVICAIKTDSTGLILNEWNTTLGKVEVLEGLEVDMFPDEEAQARDILIQLVAESTAQIEQKTQESLDKIPGDYVQLQTDINQLEKDISDHMTLYPKNLFNTDDVITGYYMNGSVGSAPDQKVNSAFSYIKVPVEVGKTYIVTGTSFTCFKLGENGNILQTMGSSSADTPNFVFSVQEKVSDVIINFKHGVYPIESYMMVEGTILPEEYVPCGDVLSMFKGKKQYYVMRSEYEKYCGETNKSIDTISETSNTALDKIESSIETYPMNLFNKSDVVKGYYMNGSVGSSPSEKENADFSYIKVPVESGKSYIISGTSFLCFKLDSSGNILQSVASSTSNIPNFTFTAQEKVAYFLINFRHAKYPIESYMIVEGTTLPEEYVPYGEIVRKIKGGQYYVKLSDFDRLKEEMKAGGSIYTVGTGKDFQSFTECIRSLKNDARDKIIYVYGGVYNIFEEIGGKAFADTLSSVSANDWRKYSDVIPPNTSIYGIGNVLFVFEPTTDEISENASYILSPINVSGSCLIENIDIHADNCRYCIHDETSGDTQFSGAKKVYRNVTCLKKKTGQRGYVQAYGAGFDDRMQFIFENCVFESTTGIACSLHNRDTVSEYDSSMIISKNSAFISDSGDTSFRLGNINWRQEHIKVHMSGCYFSNDMLISNESGYGKKNAYDLTLVRCNDVNVRVVPETNIYPVKKYI